MAMATASPGPLSHGQAGHGDAEEKLNRELRQLPDEVLQVRLRRMECINTSRLSDGGEKFRRFLRAVRRELARRQAAAGCLAPPTLSPQPLPPPRRQGDEPDDETCERIVQSRCAESSDIQVTASLPAQMEIPACPTKQLPDAHIIKPKLEPCDDSPGLALDTTEDWETTPLSGNHPFFTTVMSRSQVQKSFQLHIPSHFLHHLPKAHTAVTLLCGGKSWAMSYRGDLKVKKLDAAWMDFAVDNQLRVKDACVFELVTGTGGEELVFQVQILRGGLPEEVTSKGCTADNPLVIVD